MTADGDTHLACFEHGPAAGAGVSIIWLHGLGADGHDFEPMVDELALPDSLHPRYLFPNAPLRPVTVNGRMEMRAWYDIAAPDLLQGQDEPGIRDAEHRIRALIDHERRRGVDPGRIVLGGFSQGGAMALHTGLRYPDALAGIAALSGYLPLAERLDGEATGAGRGVPIFMAHGEDDPVVPFQHGESSQAFLVARGYAVTWQTYPITHTVTAREVADLKAWLLAILGAEPA